MPAADGAHREAPLRRRWAGQRGVGSTGSHLATPLARDAARVMPARDGEVYERAAGPIMTCSRCDVGAVAAHE